MTHSTAPVNSEAQASAEFRAFALALVSRFGERAVSYATHQSLKAISSGDSLNASRWRRMAEVTREILRSETDEDTGAQKGAGKKSPAIKAGQVWDA